MISIKSLITCHADENVAAIVLFQNLLPVIIFNLPNIQINRLHFSINNYLIHCVPNKKPIHSKHLPFPMRFKIISNFRSPRHR